MSERKELSTARLPWRIRSAAPIVLVLLLGMGLRAWGLSRLGLVHFDEGVYALSGIWSLSSVSDLNFYAKQDLFAPPAYVILVGFASRLFGGASDLAAILVSVLFGSATILLTWWAGCKWFGREAGIAAATFLALSQYHIALSRAALTDVTFGFFFLLALVWITFTFETGSFFWAVLSGLSVGVAWNTKYHGWLPSAIAALALVGLMVSGRLDAARMKRLCWCWLLLSLVAALCYLPWAVHVQGQPGGYLALTKYQRTFLSRHWLQNLFRQAAMQWYLDGWLSRSSPIIASLLAITSTAKWRAWGGWAACLAASALLLSSLVLGGAGTAIVLALLVLPALWRNRSFGSWVLFSALAVLFFSTPLYRPYARLSLPLMICIYIAAGASLSWILRERLGERSDWSAPPSWPRLSLVFTGAALAGLVCGVAGFWPAPRTWMATDSVRRAVSQILESLPAKGTVIVHGGPEVAFYFVRAGRRVIPIDDPLDDPQVASQLREEGQPYFLVTGIYSGREPRSRKSLQRLAGKLDLVCTYPVEVNDVRLLDDFSPKRAWEFCRHPTQEYALHLYRIHSPLSFAASPKEPH